MLGGKSIKYKLVMCDPDPTNSFSGELACRTLDEIKNHVIFETAMEVRRKKYERDNYLLGFNSEESQKDFEKYYEEREISRKRYRDERYEASWLQVESERKRNVIEVSFLSNKKVPYGTGIPLNELAK